MPLQTDHSDWLKVFASTLPLLGHRNWIVIADSAYPLQTAPGITTLVTDTDHVTVLRRVLAQLDDVSHVRAKIYMDSELEYIAEQYAHGITNFRKEAARVLENREIRTLPHEEIIYKLSAAGKEFHILLLKTTLTLPYTSVFLELDCGYWTAEGEEDLRAKIAQQQP